ncbi:MAG: YesL family protein [Clostridium sp.]|nr:YesL family protein [Clostridium sp.]
MSDREKIDDIEEKERELNKYKNQEPFLKRALDAFGNIFALNVCFVIGCIPVFTIGASLSALYAMCIRLQEDEEETVAAGFIHEFKRSFKQSTIAFFAILLALFVMYGEFMLIKTVPGAISTFYTGVLILELIVFALIVPFLFPLIARYNNKLSVSMRNSIILAMTYKWSWIKVMVAWFAPIAICIIYPEIFVYIWYLWLLLIFGAIAYGTSATMRKIFRLNEQRMEEAAKKAEEEARKAEEEAEEDEDVIDEDSVDDNDGKEADDTDEDSIDDKEADDTDEDSIDDKVADDTDEDSIDDKEADDTDEDSIDDKEADDTDENSMDKKDAIKKGGRNKSKKKR